MGLLSTLSIPYAHMMGVKNKPWINQPIKSQNKLFRHLISKAKNTLFGNDHSFERIRNYEDFVAHVPIRDYEAIKPYIDKVIEGQKDILWKGRPCILQRRLAPRLVLNTSLFLGSLCLII